MLEFFRHNTILLLFIVIAIGYFLGKAKWKGFSLGVASVLFVGLAFGAIDPEFKLPDAIYTLGLIFFVYTIGLQSGPSFFASLNKQGITYNIAAILIIFISFLATLLISYFVKLKSSILAGLFCGSLTNTPAIATVVDIIKNSNSGKTGVELDALLSEPVIGYSISYPFGVIGVILAILLFQKIFKIDMEKESEEVTRKMGLGGEELENQNVIVKNQKLFGWTVKEVFKAKDLKGVIISKITKKDITKIVDGDTIFEEGDIITLVGTREQLNDTYPIFGDKLDSSIEVDRNALDYRRIVVSNSQVIGVPLRELDLHKKFKATITRLKRGDIDIVPTNDTVLQAGDRIRVVASKEELTVVSKFFGDSFQSISQIDYISISIGITLGLLLGSIAIPLPGGTSFKLGFAGGPLIVSLILGKLGRTGKMVWSISYNANLTLRQMGLVLFLAGIGLKSGYSFATSLSTYGSVLLVSGAFLTFLSSSLMLWVGVKILKIPYPLLVGIVAGFQTQPAVLAFCNDQIKNSAPNLGYSIVFPTAMITKIILASFIYKLLL